MKKVIAVVGMLAGSASAQEGVAPPGAELGIHVGYARGEDQEGEHHAGPGVRLHLLKNLGSYLSVGPEAAVYAYTGSRVDVTFDGVNHFYNTRNRPLVQLGAMARLGVSLGRVRPALIGGVALYKGTVTNLGYSVGGEVELLVTDWLPLSFDARLHQNLYNYTYESDTEKRYVSVGVGWRRSW